MKYQAIAVLGDGSFGTAIAILLANNGHEVTLWCHNHAITESINKVRINPFYHSEVILPAKIKATSDMSGAVSNADIIFQAIPVAHMRSVIQQAAEHASPETPWVSLSKGIEEMSLYFPSAIIQSCFKEIGFLKAPSVLVASGPSFAQDIIAQQPIQITLAGIDSQLVFAVAQLMENQNFKTTYSHDMLGVQALGALKNIYAIALAMAQGLASDSTKSCMFLAALTEQREFLKNISGNDDTLYSNAGIGDLLLTSSSMQSRNTQAGILLAQHHTLEEITTILGHLPEGINTLKSIKQLQKKYSMELPLAAVLYRIVFEQVPPAELITTLRALI